MLVRFVAREHGARSEGGRSRTKTECKKNYVENKKPKKGAGRMDLISQAFKGEITTAGEGGGRKPPGIVVSGDKPGPSDKMRKKRRGTLISEEKRGR